MKMKLFLLLIFVVIALTGKAAFAETTASVSVSFVIPVMPGLNAPLIEEESVKAQPTEETTVQEKSRDKTELVEEERNTVLIASSGQKENIKLKTVYSR
ncbi:MAG: hypothetical protein V1653_01495 [bacterium]